MRKKWSTGVIFIIGFALCCLPIIWNVIEQRHQSDAVATYQNAVSKKDDTKLKEIMDNAAIHAFFPLDDRTAASAAKLLNIDPQALTLLETGECYIKGTFYNQNRQKAIPGILHGTTYRNFKKAKPKLHKRPFIDVPCFDEKRCNFPPAKN